MGLGHPHGIELGAVAFHTATDGLSHQVFDLFPTDLHIPQPLAASSWVARASVSSSRSQQLRPHWPWLITALVISTAVRCSPADWPRGDGKAIQQVIAHVAFLWVVGGDQQGPAGVAEAEAFAFHAVLTTARPPASD